MKGKSDIVKLLIKTKAHINAMDGYGETPLIKVEYNPNVILKVKSAVQTNLLLVQL